MDPEKQGTLHEFFAVTRTSVYRVTDEFDEAVHEPIVEKIAVNGESRVKVGDRLRGGNIIGITGRFGLVMYIEDFSPFAAHPRTQRPEEVNTAYWGRHTSSVTGLFLEREKALKCLESENRIPCDPRWEEETLEVLKKIGDGHPVFIISKMEDVRISYLTPSFFIEETAKAAS